ncbi:uncharacterized protein LOC110833576 [Zootermopsis nevadensis]|uniref:uncharacterized protein LOC110833576 n=1 Tax=Zootermopsis nevadensis TaxID=136037 RepID=UPI000B8E7B58|nr:uncharacterized protein LOC110833576 [Zootermopsis nevadensis]
MTARHLQLLIVVLILSTAASGPGNLTCYQCTKYKNEECGSESLLPCPPSKDRCVTHISNDAQNGFSLKRECGLGPCGFEDTNVMRGLGMDTCDRSKDEYFCIFCCTQNGCNKAAGGINWPSASLLAAMAVLVTCVCVSTYGM